MSHFPFVDNKVLQTNIDQAFIHIIDLLTLSESETYKGEEKKALTSSLRKTIIIHTVSIVEALLQWKLTKEVANGKAELSDEWNYRDWKVIFELESGEQIASVIRKKAKRDVEDLHFQRLIDYCFKYKILTTDKIMEDLKAVQKLRNRLHIGNLSEVEKEYSKTDLKLCFDVARRVKNRLEKL